MKAIGLVIAWAVGWMLCVTMVNHRTTDYYDIYYRRVE